LGLPGAKISTLKLARKRALVRRCSLASARFAPEEMIETSIRCDRGTLLYISS
jgi:hypothetical protein